MLLAVYARTGRPGSDALIQGARVAGVPVVQQRPIFAEAEGALHGVTAVVLDGIKGDKARIRDRYRALGVPVYILELPRLRAASGPDQTDATRIMGLYRDTLHDLPVRIGNRAVVGGVIADRTPTYTLVCGQKPDDASHGMDADACARWARAVIPLVRLQYGLPVCYRPHPRAVKWHDPAETFGADRVSAPMEETIREALAGAAALVTWNSTTGVDAIDAGVPVLYGAAPVDCAYAPYAARIGEPLRILTSGEREACLLRFAACQWTREQLEDGTAVRCLFLGADWPAAQILTQDEAEAEARDALALDAAAGFAADAGRPTAKSRTRRRAA